MVGGIIPLRRATSSRYDGRLEQEFSNSNLFEDYYTLGEFTKDDYPNLLQGAERVDTVAVPAVLAVFNWSKNSDRYLKVQRFVEYLFARWDRLQKPPFHPKWREVNLAATVPGWTRFSAAQEMLDRVHR